MNIWHDIPKERIKKDDFTAVIEIPNGGKNKYENGQGNRYAPP